jgi:hypothetical protein
MGSRLGKSKAVMLELPRLVPVRAVSMQDSSACSFVVLTIFYLRSAGIFINRQATAFLQRLEIN